MKSNYKYLTILIFIFPACTRSTPNIPYTPAFLSGPDPTRKAQLPTQPLKSETSFPSQEKDFTPGPIQLEEPTFVEGDQPVFIFLFTHTEDHINHELSEERYQRLAPVVERLASQNPDAHLVWTIEFMGADAKTVAERNPSTGVSTLLRDYAAQGIIEFGYHAQHEPTYLNRPQKSLTPNSSWEEMVEAIESFVTCEKNPLRGGCVIEGGGGLLSIEDNFGAVQIVTGLSQSSQISITGGSVRHALIRHLPTYILSFGFSGHAPNVNPQVYFNAVESLIGILTPTLANSPGIFWMDDAIRINDSGAIDTLGSLTLKEGSNAVRGVMRGVDRSRPQVMNAGFASKYIYTASGESPTN